MDAAIVSAVPDDDPGFLIDCTIVPRPDQKGPMFIARKDGALVARLKGYTIAPTHDTVPAPKG
jgi:hypothetical protein